MRSTLAGLAGLAASTVVVTAALDAAPPIRGKTCRTRGRVVGPAPPIEPRPAPRRGGPSGA